MKQKILLFTFMTTLAWASLTSMKRDPSNPPTGSTGAPSELTCARSGCHSGGAYTGEVTLTGVPDVITPNTTYTLVLKQTSNASRAGFQLTCLDGSNAKCGTLITASGCNVTSTTSPARQYIRQSSAKTLSGGSTSWTFQWTSPTAMSGNKATFYFSSLAANGNGGTSGDNVLVGTKNVTANVITATDDAYENKSVRIYPNPTKGEVTLEAANYVGGTAILYNLKGEMMTKTPITIATQTIDVSNLAKGVYMMQIQHEDTKTIKKLIIQ